MWPSLCPFPWEVNHNAGAAGAMPWVIEYWFVRPESAFMRNMGAWWALLKGGAWRAAATAELRAAVRGGTERHKCISH